MSEDTPAHKTETGTAYTWETTNSKLSLQQHLQWWSLCDPEIKKYFSHPKFFACLLAFCPTPLPIKLKLALQIRRRLLIWTLLRNIISSGAQYVTLAAHLEQSNYLPNQKQRAVHKYDLKCFYYTLPRPPPGVLKDVHFFQGQEQSSSGFAGFDSVAPHPRFPVLAPHTKCWWRCWKWGQGWEVGIQNIQDTHSHTILSQGWFWGKQR